MFLHGEICKGTAQHGVDIAKKKQVNVHHLDFGHPLKLKRLIKLTLWQ